MEVVEAGAARLAEHALDDDVATLGDDPPHHERAAAVRRPLALRGEVLLDTQRERAAHGGGAFMVRRVVTEGRNVVVEGVLGEALCAGFYDLHDGLIAGAVEYWVGEPA